MWKRSLLLSIYAIAVMYALSMMSLASTLGSRKETRTLLSRDETSSDSEDCGSSSSGIRCLFVCLTDPSCETLGFNRSELACACPCQLCPDGNYYGSFQDYTNSEPLTEAQRNKCPDVQYPCNNDN